MPYFYDFSFAHVRTYIHVLYVYVARHTSQIDDTVCTVHSKSCTYSTISETAHGYYITPPPPQGKLGKKWEEISTSAIGQAVLHLTKMSEGTRLPQPGLFSQTVSRLHCVLIQCFRYTLLSTCMYCMLCNLCCA